MYMIFNGIPPNPKCQCQDCKNYFSVPRQEPIQIKVDINLEREKYLKHYIKMQLHYLFNSDDPIVTKAAYNNLVRMGMIV